MLLCEVDDGTFFIEGGFDGDWADGAPDVSSEGCFDGIVDGKSDGSKDGALECLNIL
jgi:hypothetical protein